MNEVSLSLLIRLLLISVGTFTLILGFIGIFLPVIPTTPFWLVTAGCYVRSSDKLYHWFIHHRFVSDEFRRVLAGEGITLRTKTMAFVLGWSMIVFSIVFFVQTTLLRVLLFSMALLQATILYKMKTYEPEPVS